jgi:propionate CoA-transferase
VKSEQNVNENGLEVINPGRSRKFVNQVRQVTFSGKYAIQKNQEVIYITERAVFKLTPDGVVLTEIAPGIDLQNDVLDMMDFKPLLSTNLKRIDNAIYSENDIGLKEKFNMSLQSERY